ncbi:MAG: flagellar motor switch protein FliN [Actinobacteria bacterium]|nr:flagellar motor switch protein FliN [Actinomycetota bacterium]
MSNEDVVEVARTQEGADAGGASTGTGGIAGGAPTGGAAVAGVPAAGGVAAGGPGGDPAGSGAVPGMAPGPGSGSDQGSDLSFDGSAGGGHDGYGPERSRDEASGSQVARPIEILQGVEMAVTVELGHTRMMVRDLLGLRVGSIIELDRQVGSNVDILVNGTLLAKGEVVVVDDEMGVRITDIARRDMVYEER